MQTGNCELRPDLRSGQVDSCLVQITSSGLRTPYVLRLESGVDSEIRGEHPSTGPLLEAGRCFVCTRLEHSTGYVTFCWYTLDSVYAKLQTRVWALRPSSQGTDYSIISYLVWSTFRTIDLLNERDEQRLALFWGFRNFSHVSRNIRWQFTVNINYFINQF